MVEDWRLSLDNREAVAVLAIDLSNALTLSNCMSWPTVCKTKSLWLYRSSIVVDEELLAR